MPHPTDFRSPAYRILLKSLGESDAVVEWIEVGVREIQQLAASKGPDAAEDLAKAHKVCVHRVDFSELRSRTCRLQILAVYQQAEHFFRVFRDTHPRRVTYEKNKEDNILSATLRAFGLKVQDVGELEYGLFQYYRLIRNMSMHNPEGDQRKRAIRERTELREQVKESPYKTLDAPNLLEELSFDDFVLFTRSLKELAANLCTATNPTQNELVEAVREEKALMAKVRGLEKSPQRQGRLIAGFLRERYSISEERASKVSEQLLSATR